MVENNLSLPPKTLAVEVSKHLHRKWSICS